MIWTNFNLLHLRILPHMFQMFWPIGFWEIFKSFLYLFLCKKPTSYCSPTLTIGIMVWTKINQHDMQMLRSIQVSAFLTKKFFAFSSGELKNLISCFKLQHCLLQNKTVANRKIEITSSSDNNFDPINE